MTAISNNSPRIREFNTSFKPQDENNSMTGLHLPFMWPTEIWQHIFYQMDDPKDRSRYYEVCKAWNVCILKATQSESIDFAKKLFSYNKIIFQHFHTREATEAKHAHWKKIYREEAIKDCRLICRETSHLPERGFPSIFFSSDTSHSLLCFDRLITAIFASQSMPLMICDLKSEKNVLPNRHSPKPLQHRTTY